MEFNELIRGFAESIGLSGLEPDENGNYAIAVDEMTVVFTEQAEAGLLRTSAEVCELPTEGTDLIRTVLLKAMFPGGGGADGFVFSLDPEGRSVCLHRTDPLAALDVAGFRGLLEKFVNTLEEWRTTIREFSPALGKAEKELVRREDEARSFAMNSGDFLQV